MISTWSPALGLLAWLAGCSALFDGQEYVSADAAATDASVDAGRDTAPPDPCGGSCAGVTSICEPTTPMCVQCLADHDCTSDLLACDTVLHTCVACTADNASACTGATPVCELDGHSCVACNADADCSDAAPVCTDHACGSCVDDTDCTGRLGATACDLSSGACVECTSASAAVSCASTGVCTQGNTCSGYALSVQTACQPCDSDANCASMHHCVPMNFVGAPHGSYCLKLASAGCAQPYSVASMSSSLGGQAGPYCGIDQDLVTCEAVRGLVDNVACPGGDDAECGQGGLCRTVGVLSRRCTYQCAGPAQCDRTGLPGSTCGAGIPAAGVSYCGG